MLFIVLNYLTHNNTIEENRQTSHMEDNLNASFTFHHQNHNTPPTLQFRKNSIPRKDHKVLSKTTNESYKREDIENKKKSISSKANLILPLQQRSADKDKQFLKIGKKENLNFDKSKKTKKKMETNVLIPLTAKPNTTRLFYETTSCQNIENWLWKVKQQNKTRSSSNQGSFESQQQDSVGTSFRVIPQIAKFPLKIAYFQLGECIGSGKFGDVHICRHKQTNFIFALKKILKSTILQYKMLPQFISELKIQYHLDHPNIVKLYAHFDDEYHIFLLMEYAPSGTLMNKIHNTQAYTAKVMEQMLDTICYTHRHKIIHRDIKPQNIVVFFEDTFKLCDFGLAAALDYYNDIRTSFCGTLDYIAPEMKDLGLYNFSVDIWGLGVLCYEILYGKAPFKDEITKWKKRGGKRFSNWNWQIQYPSYTSSSALTFMSSLLKQNPNERMSIPSALHSQFVTSQKNKNSLLTPSEETLLTLKL